MKTLDILHTTGYDKFAKYIVLATLTLSSQFITNRQDHGLVAVPFAAIFASNRRKGMRICAAASLPRTLSIRDNPLYRKGENP